MRSLATNLRGHVFVCTNKREEGNSRGCCFEKGGMELMTKLKRGSREMGLDDIRVNKSGCLGRCEEGPSCVVYPEGIWYTIPDDEAGINLILNHLAGGGPANELIMGENK